MGRVTLLLIALATSLPRHSVGATAGGPMHAIEQRGGLRLEVTVPRAAYPQNALIRVHAIARNVTRHSVWIESSGPMEPGVYLPQVEVLDQVGRVLPLALTTYFPYPGPPPIPIALNPGQTVGGQEVIVLRGPWLRVQATLEHVPEISGGRGVTFYTPALHLELLRPDAPQVHIALGSDGAFAAVVRPTGVHGQPQAVWYADCSGTNFDQRIDWTTVSTRIEPGCLPLLAWHVLIGWPGHSVASVDWPGR